MFENVKEITENIYKQFALYPKEFETDYFPYFKLVKIYENYQYHFLVIKKDYTNNGRNQINPWEYNCLQFCPHFFEVYRGRGKIQDVNARYVDKEAAFTCKNCLDIFKIYKRSTISMFFDFIKRILIQYFVPMKEYNRVMVAYFGNYFL